MKYLVTGFTGSLGTEVTKLLLEKGHTVIGYSRDELKQHLFLKHPNLVKYLGDVRDQKRLLEASRGVDGIFHFAALKQVDTIEMNPEEGIQTNLYGTMNILSAQRLNKVPKVTLSSTDKAAYPVNVYGGTKFIAERLVLRNQSNVVCRYGNVLASRGSLVGALVKTLKAEGKVYLTDPNMTRFWITIKDAANFVVTNGLNSSSGLKIPQMKAATIYAVANVVSYVLGLRSFSEEVTGHRPGEKMHECLRTAYDKGLEGMEEVHSNQVVQYTEDELTEILTPIVLELL